MTKKGIPEGIKKQVGEIVNRFNSEVIQDPYDLYVTRYRGNYLYLGRKEAGVFYPVCRLKYTGEMSNWELPYISIVMKGMTQTSGCSQGQNSWMELSKGH
jgi:hypothetical protein